MVFCFCPDTPPEKVTSKGSRGKAGELMLAKQDEPHQFAIGLKDSCCAEPCCCILSSAGAPFGCTACWSRKAVLEKYHENGLADYVCCQGFIPKCCCCDMGEQCRGSGLGLFCEGFCCPVFSISIARIHLMGVKHIRPDPMDYQLIACSNCLQLVSCVLDIVAIFVEEARELAQIVDCLADVFTCSVAGCMGAQIHHEIEKDRDGVVFVVVEGVPVDGAPQAVAPPGSLAAQDHQGQLGAQHQAVPVVAVPVGERVGAPPRGEEMAR